MAAERREVERKYDITDGWELPELELPGMRAVPADRVQLDAVYYDTVDGRLARDGVTLRRRTGGSDEGWHLKLPAGPDTRDEIRRPLTGDKPPAALVALVRSRTLDGFLVPVVRLRSARAPLTLLDGDGNVLAEVSVDDVRAHRMPDGDETRWRELEVELEPGVRPAVLDRVEKVLRRQVGLRRSRSSSKLQRALEETAALTPPPPAAEPDGAAGEVMAYVRQQVRAIVALDPEVRRRVPDSVHRMRVATRRLRSTFRSYRAVLDEDVTAPLGEELRWLAQELGADRDREVLVAHLTDQVGRLPSAQRLGAVRGAVRRHDRQLAAESRGRVRAALDSDRFLTLLRSLDELLADPPLREGAAGRDAEKALAKAVRRQSRRLARRVETALAVPPGPARDEAIHNARKAAKRARYAAEAARPVHGKRAKRYVKRVKAVQTLLGEHQDSVVVRGALLEIADAAHAEGDHSFTFGVLHERERTRAEDTERALPDLWRDVASFLSSDKAGRLGR